MNSGPQRSRRAKIKAEAIVEITDDAAVIEAALAHMERGEFTAGGEREARQDQVKGDVVAAVGWLVDPFGLLPDVPGTRVIRAEDSTVEVDQAGFERSVDPDFVALFPVCQCGKDSCDACGRFQLTPRTAAVLWTVAQILADQAYNDVIEHGMSRPLITALGSCSTGIRGSRGGRTRCGAGRRPARTTTSRMTSPPAVGRARRRSRTSAPSPPSSSPTARSASRPRTDPRRGPRWST